jgi:hypothetical protein
MGSIARINDRKPPMPERNRATGAAKYLPTSPIRTTMGNEIEACRIRLKSY